MDDLMCNKQKRLCGLDICRIIGILGVLSLHFNLSGVLDKTTNGSKEYWILWGIEILFLCSVNVFAMLTGYLGYKKTKLKIYRLIELLSSVLFWCIVFTVIYCCITDVVSKDVLLAYLFPPLEGRLWYITCYIPLFVIYPYINRLLNLLSCREECFLCTVLVTLLGCFPALVKVDFFFVKNGYSFLWLTVCYIIGHCIKKIDIRVPSYKAILLVLAGFCGSVFIKIFMFYFAHEDTWYCMNYISPFIIVEAIGVLLLCINVKIEKKYIKNIIVVCSTAVFDVYTIHCHPFVFDNYIAGSFETIVDNGTFSILCHYISFVLGTFIACTLLSILKDKLLVLLRIKRMLFKISNKIDEFVDAQE